MKVGFISLGCPKNLVDTEVMMGHLVAQGHEVTPRAEDADVIVVNTCSFIDPAKQESVDTILEMAEFKKSGKAKRLVVAGCLVERYGADIRKSIAEVDAVVGTNQLVQIGAAVSGAPTAPANEPYLYHDLTPRLRATPKHYAYLKIAEGCDHPCAFCVIPQFRGRFRSRRPDSVVAEARRLFEEGVEEINLIGQDTTCYGEDLGMSDGLAQLLDRLAREPLAYIRPSPSQAQLGGVARRRAGVDPGEDLADFHAARAEGLAVEEDGRRIARGTDRLREGRGPVDPRVEDLALIGASPRDTAGRGAGEVDHRVGRFDGRGIHSLLRRRPAELVRPGGRAAHEPQHRVAVGLELSTQFRTDESGCPGHQNAQGSGPRGCH